MLTVKSASRAQRPPWLLYAFLMAALAFMLVVTGARAQEASALTPNFGNGKLSIEGAGFKPNEKITITVKLDSGASTFSVTADAQGAFNLDTGLAVQPGSSVQLDARGDQGSGAAAITSVPALPLPTTGASMPSFDWLLLAGLLLALAGALLLIRSVKRRAV